MKLTLGDLETLEEQVCRPFSEIIENPTAKALVVLAWIVHRKEDAAFTIDDARDLGIDEMTKLGEELASLIPDTPNPTGAASS